MLFKTKGAEKHLNRLPLIVQAVIKLWNWRISLFVLQVVVYVSIAIIILIKLEGKL